MFVSICNASGVKQGYLNIDRMDKIGEPETHGENLNRVTFTQGTTTVAFYLNATALHDMLNYIDTGRLR